MRKKRNLTKKLLVNGLIIEAISIAGFAEYVGRTRRTMLRYEEQGVIPPAPLVLKGVRYYPLTLVQRVEPLINQLPTNRKPPADLIVQITQAFNQERTKLTKVCHQENQ